MLFVDMEILLDLQKISFLYLHMLYTSNYPIAKETYLKE